MLQFAIRVLLIFACSLSGYFIANNYYGFPFALIGLLSGFLVAILVIQVEQGIRKVSLRVIFGGVLGMITGLIIAVLLGWGFTYASTWVKAGNCPVHLYSFDINSRLSRTCHRFKKERGIHPPLLRIIVETRQNR